MKRNEILKNLMLQKNLCTADIARLTGIPYTTLKSIFDRGVEKSSYSSVCAICAALARSNQLSCSRRLPSHTPRCK